MGHDHATAVFQALFVTALWASSIVIIKGVIGAVDPLSFAAHRYMLATLALLAYAYHKKALLPRGARDHALFFALGLTGYACAQGGLYLGLSYLTAVTYAFILALSPLFATAMGVAVLGERPRPVQYAGIVLSLVGVAAFFYGRGVLESPPLGISIALCSSVGWAAYHILLRKGVARGIDALALTIYPMAWGTLVLLIAGIASHPAIPGYGVREYGALAVLSTVNTAWAFLLWTRAQEALFAFEQTVLHNAILPFSAFFAYLALGERISSRMALGIFLLFAGVLLAQARIKRHKP